jgi:hypothetical protein
VRATAGAAFDTVIDFSTIDLLLFLLVIVATAPWSGWDDWNDS